ncbi:hypothetical protein GCM10009839_56260 [Catenulispora yoronensis]|uniref:Anti-sigma factor n=1 Tax=Catenulispora yoronensis TaxID=450799 RepID=A0ABP5GIC4_9ACTN
MTKFADSLYQSLMDEHGDTLAAMEAHGPAGRSLRPVWASAGTIAAVATAAVGFTAFGGTASAYAVTDNHDGTVTVKVDKPSGVAGANAALARIKSRVAVVEAKPGCPSIDTFRIPGGAGSPTRVDTRFAGTDPGSVTVSAWGLPADETALLVFSFDHGKSTSAMVPIKGRPPVCVSLPAAPPDGAVVTGGVGLTATVGPDDAPALSRQDK